MYVWQSSVVCNPYGSLSHLLVSALTISSFLVTLPTLRDNLTELVEGIVDPSFWLAEIPPVNYTPDIVLTLPIVVGKFLNGGPDDAALQKDIQPRPHFFQGHLTAFGSLRGKFQQRGQFIHFILHKALNFDDLLLPLQCKHDQIQRSCFHHKGLCPRLGGCSYAFVCNWSCFYI